MWCAAAASLPLSFFISNVVVNVTKCQRDCGISFLLFYSKIEASLSSRRTRFCIQSVAAHTCYGNQYTEGERCRRVVRPPTHPPAHPLAHFRWDRRKESGNLAERERDHYAGVGVGDECPEQGKADVEASSINWAAQSQLECNNPARSGAVQRSRSGRLIALLHGTPPRP